MWEFFVSYGYSLFMKVIKCFIVRSKRGAWPAPSLDCDQSAAKNVTDVPPYLYPLVQMFGALFCHACENFLRMRIDIYIFSMIVKFFSFFLLYDRHTLVTFIFSACFCFFGVSHK